MDRTDVRRSPALTHEARALSPAAAASVARPSSRRWRPVGCGTTGFLAGTIWDAARPIGHLTSSHTSSPPQNCPRALARDNSLAHSLASRVQPRCRPRPPSSAPPAPPRRRPPPASPPRSATSPTRPRRPPGARAAASPQRLARGETGDAHTHARAGIDCVPRRPPDR
jgi:hypothetical protein